MKIKNSPYFIGKKVKFSKAFPMACRNRFPDIYHAENVGEVIGRTKNPIPVMDGQEFDGFVIGIRRAIMSNYSYKPSITRQGYFDAYPETKPAYASGKSEFCLVVTPRLESFRPVLVREMDLI